jgi:hypothetical protein
MPKRTGAGTTKPTKAQKDAAIWAANQTTFVPNALKPKPTKPKSVVFTVPAQTRARTQSEANAERDRRYKLAQKAIVDNKSAVALRASESKAEEAQRGDSVVSLRHEAARRAAAQIRRDAKGGGLLGRRLKTVKDIGTALGNEGFDAVPGALSFGLGNEKVQRTIERAISEGNPGLLKQIPHQATVGYAGGHAANQPLSPLGLTEIAAAFPIFRGPRAIAASIRALHEGEAAVQAAKTGRKAFRESTPILTGASKVKGKVRPATTKYVVNDRVIEVPAARSRTGRAVNNVVARLNSKTQVLKKAGAEEGRSAAIQNKGETAHLDILKRKLRKVSDVETQAIRLVAEQTTPEARTAFHAQQAAAGGEGSAQEAYHAIHHGITEQAAKYVQVAPDGSVQFRPDAPKRITEAYDALAQASKTRESMLEAIGSLANERAAERIYGPARVVQGARWKDYETQVETALDASPGRQQLIAAAKEQIPDSWQHTVALHDAAARALAQRTGNPLAIGIYYQDVQHTVVNEPFINAQQFQGHGFLAEVSPHAAAKEVQRIDAHFSDPANKQALVDELQAIADASGTAKTPHTQPVPPLTMEQLANGLIDMLKEGVLAKHWYKDSAQVIVKEAGGDMVKARKIAGLIAAFSPQNAVYPNVRAAVEFWNHFKNVGADEIEAALEAAAKDGKVHAWFPAHDSKTGIPEPTTKAAPVRGIVDNRGIAKAVRIMKGEEPAEVLGGRKITSFYSNFLQEADPAHFKKAFPGQDPKVGKVTFDTWMRRAYGYHKAPPVLDKKTGKMKEGEAITDKQYEFGEKTSTALANAIGWKPHEVQAAIWTSVKSRIEGLDFSRGGTFHAGSGFDEVRAKDKLQILHERELQQGVDPAWNPYKGGEVFSEPRPVTNPDRLAAYDALSKEEKAAYTQQVTQNMDGKFEDILGLPAQGGRLGDGVWRGQIEPGFAAHVELPEGVLSPEDAATMNVLSAAQGWSLHAGSVSWGHKVPKDTPIGGDVFEGRHWTPKKGTDIGALDDALNPPGQEGSIGLVHAREGGFNVVNFGHREDFSEVLDAHGVAPGRENNRWQGDYTIDKNSPDAGWEGEKTYQDVIAAHPKAQEIMNEVQRQQRLGDSAIHPQNLADRVGTDGAGGIIGAYLPASRETFYSTRADATTFAHEMAHHIRQVMDPAVEHQVAKEMGAKWVPEIGADGKAIRGKGEYKWDEAAEEKFAESVVRVLRDGHAPETPGLRNVFRAAAKDMREGFYIHDLPDLPPHVADAIRNLFHYAKIDRARGSLVGAEDIMGQSGMAPIYTTFQRGIPVNGTADRAANALAVFAHRATQVFAGGRAPIGAGPTDTSLNHTFKGSALLSGFYKVSLDGNIDAGIKASKLSLAHRMRPRLLAASSALPTSTADIPIKVDPRKNSSAEVRKVHDLLDSLGDTQLDDEALQNITHHLAESVNDSVFPRTHVNDAGETVTWDQTAAQAIQDQIPIDNIRWLPAEFVHETLLKHEVSKSVDYGKLVRGAGTTLDVANDLAKAGILFLSPAYAPVNLIGNLVMNLMQQGVWMPSNLARSAFLHRTLDKADRLFIDKLMGHGISGALATTRLAQKPTAAAAHGLGVVVDLIPRRSAFLHEAQREGYATNHEIQQLISDFHAGDQQAIRDIEMITRRANDAIVDYERMSPFEKNIMTRVFFVYPWLRGSSRWTIKYALDHPMQAAALTLAADYAYENANETLGDRPGYARQQIPISTKSVGLGIPGTDLGVGLDNLVGDHSWTDSQGRPKTWNPRQALTQTTPLDLSLTAVGYATGSGDADAIANMLNPVPKAALVAAFGYDPFKQKEVPRSVKTFAEQLVHLPLQTRIENIRMSPEDRAKADVKKLNPESSRDSWVKLFMGGLTPTSYNVKVGTGKAARDKGGLDNARYTLLTAAKDVGITKPPPQIVMDELEWKQRWNHDTNRADNYVERLAATAKLLAEKTGNKAFLNSTKIKDEQAAHEVYDDLRVLLTPSLDNYTKTIRELKAERKK